MDNIESNKLMAEFLGWFYNEKYHYWVTEENNYYEKLFFHNDWNWLMQVVEKIEETDKIVINGNNCILQYNLAFYVGADIKSLTKIQAVYLACLKFIQNESNN